MKKIKHATCLLLFSYRSVMGSATVPSVTNLPTMEIHVHANCTMSAETEKHVRSMETVGTDISGYFTVESRLGIEQSYDTHTHTDANTKVEQR